MPRHDRDRFGLGLERGFPRQRERVHRGRGHRVGFRPGACVCGPGRPGGETLDPTPGGVRSAFHRVAESSKATFKFGDSAEPYFL
jgi:hypothetical protein